MLTELVVANLVIVANARLMPGDGLTAISGETGAGKSLILDAIALLGGARGGAKLVGPHAAEASVTAVIQVDAATAALAESRCGVAAIDGQFILRRRLAESGRSQAWINDQPVTVAALKACAETLVEIHAQHEALALAAPARQLALIDAYGGHAAQAVGYRAAHRRALDLAAELAQLDGGERESLKELDFLRFQSREFAALAPKAGELAMLEARVRLLSGAEEWRALAGEAAAKLGDDERAVATVLSRYARKLSEAPDPELAAAGQACIQALEQVRDAAARCADAVDRLSGDPGELVRAQERLDGYYQLMRKHGDGGAALLNAWEQVDQRIAALEGLDQRRADAAAALDAARTERAAIGDQLAKARDKSFAKLAKAVHAELADLAMPKARIALRRTKLAVPGPEGVVDQEIEVCTNPGLPAGLLGEIASGGEASRLTLALAVALAEHERTPVIVFDEIDSGVGGRLGQAIGAKLAQLGRGRTVVAVTHTPQLAALARSHYVVRKSQDAKRTTAEVKPVVGLARADEIAEMLGGGKAALGQAKALLAGTAGTP